MIDLASSEFKSEDAAGGNDPLPRPHHWHVCARPGPGFQGCVRPLRRLLEPDQPQVGNPPALPQGRTGTQGLPPPAGGGRPVKVEGALQPVYSLIVG